MSLYNNYETEQDPPDVLTLAIIGWDAIPEDGPLTYLDLLYNMLIIGRNWTP